MRCSRLVLIFASAMLLLFSFLTAVFSLWYLLGVILVAVNLFVYQATNFCLAAKIFNKIGLCNMYDD